MCLVQNFIIYDCVLRLNTVESHLAEHPWETGTASVQEGLAGTTGVLIWVYLANITGEGRGLVLKIGNVDVY